MPRGILVAVVLGGTPASPHALGACEADVDPAAHATRFRRREEPPNHDQVRVCPRCVEVAQCLLE
jgi:hypothetical protein